LPSSAFADGAPNGVIERRPAGALESIGLTVSMISFLRIVSTLSELDVMSENLLS
jgi:hypothetical protein